MQNRFPKSIEFNKTKPELQNFLDGEMPEKVQLKYRWRKTWPDKPDDYSGRDPDMLDHAGNPVVIGRFYLAHVPGGMAWRWFVQWMPERGGVLLPSGVANSEREAAPAIERNYDALRFAHPPA